MSNCKHIIIIPFAFLSDYSGGVNFKNTDKGLTMYLKNCCVSCISAKVNAGKETDVALVTNIDIPNPYINVLQGYGVKIIKCKFDNFTFGKKVAWSLAFYKINAMWHISQETNYNDYCYMDSDVYVQSNFEYIWEECKKNILLYDICHGLQDGHYMTLLREAEAFKGKDAIGLTHYGGEFFAANRENTLSFMKECQNVYNEMMRKNITTSKGDEFIISMVASRMSLKIRNAGAYVYRYWTRRWHLMSTNYKFNPVVVLHVPQEKEHGMLAIYNKYLSKGIVPSQKKVWKILHLSKPSFSIRCALLWDKIK